MEIFHFLYCCIKGQLSVYIKFTSTYYISASCVSMSRDMVNLRSHDIQTVMAQV